MSFSITLDQRVSKQSEAYFALGPTPVTCGDLFDVHWARIWESVLPRDESGFISVLLRGHELSAGSMPASTSWSWAGTEITALIIRPPRTQPNWTALTIFSGVEPHANDAARAFADFVTCVERSVPVEIKAAADPAGIVSQIRDWADLTASDVAALMGVSRRSLYHWLSSGRISPENRERLSEIAEALRPLARVWRPTRLKSWLQRDRSAPMRLLKAGNFAGFRRLADETLAEASVPIRQARRITVSEPEPPEYAVRPLSPEQRQSFFNALLAPRPAVTLEAWIPPELTDSLPGEDE